MQTISQDVRYGVRVLRRAPAFTSVAILCLALGIGANTAIFNLLNAIALRKLPVERPEQLVQISTLDATGNPYDLSLGMFEGIARRQRVFSELIGYYGHRIQNVEVNGALFRATVWAVTGNFYSGLGVMPELGRPITAADVRLPARAPERVAVLGFRFWHRAPDGDLAAIGQTVSVDGVPFTVIGIAPEGFTGTGITHEPDVTIPLTALPLLAGKAPSSLNESASPSIETIGRLKEGLSITEARAHLETLWPTVRRESRPADWMSREAFESLRLQVTSAARGRDWVLRERFTQPLYVALAIAALILLIACVNLASLLLARAAARAHEIGIRAALGASRWRLARQVVVEGLLLSLAGGGAGVAFAWWSSEAIGRMMLRSAFVPAALRLAPDASVLMFAAGAATIVGVLFSLMPAWRLARQHPIDLTRQSPRARGGPGRAGRMLIVTQMTLSLVLLMDAGLLVRTLQQLRAVDTGLRHDNVAIAQLFEQPGGRRYRNVDFATYHPLLVERLLAVPGVSAASLSHMSPAGFNWKRPIRDAAAPSSGPDVQAMFAAVSPGFFRTVGIAVREGRDFVWADTTRTPKVAIVSRSLAQHLFSDALGRRLYIGGDPDPREVEVVGVASDARLYDPRDPSTFAVYVPLLQDERLLGQDSLLVQADTTDPSLGTSLRRVVESFGHEYIPRIQTLREVTDTAIVQERVTAMIAGFFGALALLLAATGLGGLMLYSIAQRTREIGIRAALGADRRRILGMVLREVLVLAAAGIALGLPAALAAGRLVSALLFGVEARDPATLAAAALALVSVALLTGLVPARRAVAVDPARVLQE